MNTLNVHLQATVVSLLVSVLKFLAFLLLIKCVNYYSVLQRVNKVVGVFLQI